MRFEPTTTDAYDATQPPSPVRWLGLPFALSALLPLAGVVGLIPFENEDGGDAPKAILLIFSAVFLSIGLGILLFRRRLTIDLRSRTITRRSGVGTISTTKTTRVAEDTAIVYERRVIRGQKSSSTVWPVMVGRNEDRTTDVIFCRTRHQARQTAEGIARLFEVAVVDRCDGTARRREFDELDLSLRERRQRSGEAIDPGEPPATMRSTVEVEGDELVVKIPAYGLSALHVIAMLMATGPIWMMLIFLVATGEAPDGFFLAAATLMAGLPVTLLETVILWHALRRFTVRASTEQLRVEERGLRSRTTTMPAASIEELTAPANSPGLDTFVGGGPPITASSDVAEVSFGNTLKPEETAYLTKVLCLALSAAT